MASALGLQSEPAQMQWLLLSTQDLSKRASAEADAFSHMQADDAAA